MRPITIGIIAPSSVIPKIELELGVEKLKSEGFNVVVHPSVYGENWFYSADDHSRADSFVEYALDPSIDILWCARGGYGATHLLPRIEKALKKKKVKKKLLLGFSDATALLEFSRVKLGWSAFHAPMPALKTFSVLKEDEWSVLMSLLLLFLQKKLKPSKTPHYSYSLHWIHRPKGMKTIQAPVVGGNFSVWNTLIGTPFAGNARGKILFFEDLQENVGRLNRMIHHLEQSGGLKGVKAIVLGDFSECKDTAPFVFKSVPQDLRHPKPEELMPLRATHESVKALHYIFRTLGERTGIPILGGIPVGHGDHHFTIAFGEKHTLPKDGSAIRF